MLSKNVKEATIYSEKENNGTKDNDVLWHRIYNQRQKDSEKRERFGSVADTEHFAEELN